LIYNLHSLGWASFQNLCGTILREVWGQTYQTFSDSKDAGRDGAFWGKWKPPKGEEMSGSFVVQCKFTAKANSVLRTSQVSGELDKVRRLARKGLARNYVLITNAALPSPVEDELREAFTAIPGVEHFLAFGGEWITQQIRETQRLRTLVPRVYGLGDLTEILDERVYEQAQEIMSLLGDELERFVVTDAHQKSVRALNEQKFVFLLGDPGRGKSTIAAALALAAADSWSSRVIKVRHADEFVAHWNARENNQFFWADDVFGQTQYERDHALDWNRALPQLNAALKRGARVIFTSRSYIYKAATEDLKQHMYPLLRQAQVVIEVEKLTQREREQILYNHLRLGKQTVEFRGQLKPFLSQVAAHPDFLPVIASRLADPFFTENMTSTLEGVIDYVEKSEQYLTDVIMGLGDAHKAAIGSVFMKGGTLPAPLDFDDDEKRAIEVMNSNVGEVRKSLAHLEGSLMVREIEAGETVFRFKHPTVRDAYAGIISDDPNLIDIYLSGTRVEAIIEEVSCGDRKIEGVKLIVSPARFPLILERLRELKKDKVGKRQLASFLSSRCSIDFLRYFLQEEPDFLTSLNLSRGWSTPEKPSFLRRFTNINCYLKGSEKDS